MLRPGRRGAPTWRCTASDRLHWSPPQLGPRKQVYSTIQLKSGRDYHYPATDEHLEGAARRTRRRDFAADAESAGRTQRMDLRAGSQLLRCLGLRSGRCVGAGRGFCAGASMSLLGDVPDSRPDRSVRRRLCELAEYPKPLIAAINGAAAGIGFALAISCDLRFCAETSVLTTSFAKLGLVAEHGVAWILPQLVGRAHALDLLLSGRTVRGAEAEAMGLG